MDFSGIWVPLVTPFSNDMIDYAALGALTAKYRQAGVAGVVALGTTGEAAALDDDEQLAVLDCVLQAADGLPVIAGLAGNHLPSLYHRLRQFASRPLAGLLTPAPYYIRPSQQGLLDYFTGLADISPLPLVLYDIPYRTGVCIELETLLHLAGHPNIQAIKDCAGSIDTTQQLIADGRLQVLAGEDLNLLSTLAMGGSGAIAAAAHIRPDLFVALHQAVLRQELAHARAIYHPLAPMVRLLFAEANPAPVKAALAMQGHIQNQLRAPMTVVSAGLDIRLRQGLQALDKRARGLTD